MKSLSRFQLFATPWTIAHQGLPSMEFSRQEYWSGLPFPFTKVMHKQFKKWDSIKRCLRKFWASLVAQTVKRLSAMQETPVRSLSWEDPLEKAMAPHSSTLAWKIPWMEEPDRRQSMGSLRVGHDWATFLSPFTFIPALFTSIFILHTH